MPKMKTSRAAAKRFKVTGTGKLKRNKAYKRHLSLIHIQMCIRDRFEITPELGVKVSKIVNLADDIKLNLAAAYIRSEAPIPGKAAVGIEVPNSQSVAVSFRELVESEEFKNA